MRPISGVRCIEPDGRVPPAPPCGVLASVRLGCLGRPASRRARASQRLIVVSALLLAIGCARSNGAGQADAPKDSPAVTLPSGARYTVEISSTPESRAQGLMFRESLEPGRGMLFLFPGPSVEAFWMKNCNFPIDIVWMDPTRKVIYVNAHTPPCKDDPCPTYGPKEKSQFVLEIPDGAAAKEKIAPGAVLRFENVPAAPKE